MGWMINEVNNDGRRATTRRNGRRGARSRAHLAGRARGSIAAEHPSQDGYAAALSLARTSMAPTTTAMNELVHHEQVFRFSGAERRGADGPDGGAVRCSLSGNKRFSPTARCQHLIVFPFN
jgi:hypothetical protein